ncbi:glucosamine-6-phosphate deaminase [Komarekiella sp. 'clone 1']|uniref:Glucosamine-6-phosphate deaminase n=1 Tax=Komarekiella delphini-convector SJRDD-AB1 TaxID=2593771 RepID=A0AA40SZG5_9NOST|nr:glucosamine-6-phosphate deaminase [Komarekiella delphini-convector]MBD6617889.1 glucosamine-6-phosphate deaminase [Komarekiella delphini-convector SJRDD-AB1]
MLAATNIFRVDDLLVQIYNSEVEMAQNVAEIAQKYLQDVLAQQDTAAVLLATGNSQLKFLDALITLGGVDWSRITLFHLDEYLGIAADHAASFRRYMRERVEQRVEPKKFHYIEGDTLQPVAECDRYTKLLQAQLIDLCCLGIGENGHLAFNDPSVADFQDPYSVKLVKLDTANRLQQVSTGHFPNLEAVPQYAFTLTIPMICTAKKILCLAPEKRKAHVVKEILQRSISTDYPASILRQQPQATLFLDVNSASLLS